MVGKVKVPFRERYRASRQIFGQSMRLLGKERDVWLFPALSVITMFLGLGTMFGVYWILFGSMATYLEIVRETSGILMTAAIIAGSLVVMYPFGVVMTVFQTALAHCLNERLSRRAGTKREGMRRAWSLIGPIARFALVASLVSGAFAVLGVVLDRLRLVPYLGQVLQAVGAFAWAAASFFVIPILVVKQERSALGALKGSVEIARQQWGKAVAGVVTVSLAVMVPMMVVMIGAMLVLQPFIMFFMIDGGSLILWPIFVMVGVLLTTVLVGSTLSQAAFTAYQVALYRYATKGKVVKPFTKETLDDVWAPYKQA